MKDQANPVSTEIADAIRRVVDYLYEEERHSYEEEPSESHIFHAVSVLDRFLEEHRRSEDERFNSGTGMEGEGALGEAAAASLPE